jgi:hypothetical protein
VTASPFSPTSSSETPSGRRTVPFRKAGTGQSGRHRGAGPPAGQRTHIVRHKKAWAVQRNADSTITVRIAQFAFDGAALQQALEAEGVPALVRYQVVSDPG